MTGSPLAADELTVNAIGFGPAAPSATDALATDTLGRTSSLTMVPVPVFVPSVAFTGFESVTVKVSFASYSLSPTTLTVIVAFREPAGIVTDPLFAA